MESSFSFANVEFITVPATSFTDDQWTSEIGSSDLCMEKKGIDAEYNVYHRCLCYFPFIDD